MFQQFSAKQAAIFRKVVHDRQSVVISGSAGTGKSFLAKEIAATVEGTVSCAPSAAAAVLLPGGRTIHSLFGFRPCNLSPTGFRDLEQWKLRDTLKGARLIIVDEISLVSHFLFEAMDDRLKEVHGNSRVFGDIQVVALGDFCQLPPISKRPKRGLPAVRARFCSTTSSFELLFGANLFRLTEPMRQREDPTYANLLDRVRVGAHTAEDVALLSTQVIKYPRQDVLHLYVKREGARRYNEARLEVLEAPLHTFTAIDTGGDSTLANETALPQEVSLKVGAPVILINNSGPDLYNGMRGTVVGFSRAQEAGQIRRVGLASELMLPLHYPVVEFDGYKCLILPIAREQNYVETDKNGKSHVKVVTRVQIPLLLGYAITVHRAQGATLSEAHLMLDGAWEPGHVYVALSRVPTLARVTLSPEALAGIRVHPSALEIEDRFQ